MNRSFKRKAKMITSKFFTYTVAFCMLAGSVFWLSAGNVFAALGDVQLFTDGELQATSTDNGDGSYVVGLTYTGSTLNATLTGSDKQAVFYSEDLTGLLTADGDATVNVTLLPITLNDLDIGGLDVSGTVNTLATTLTDLVDTITNDVIGSATIGNLVTVQGLDELQLALDNLNTLGDRLEALGVYTDEIPYTINPDGTIVVDFNNGLGSFLEDTVNNLLVSTIDDIQTAIAAIDITLIPVDPITDAANQLIVDPILDGVVATALGAANTALTTAEGIIVQVPPLLNDALGAQILGKTTISLNVIVTDPLVPSTTIYAAAVQEAIVDLSFLGDSTAFAEVIFDETAPDAPTATVTGDQTSGYDVTGEAEPSSTVTVYDDAGVSVGTATAEEDGSYIVHLEPTAVDPEEVLGVTATDAVGNESTPPTPAIVPAADSTVAPTNPVTPVNPTAPATDTNSPTTGDATVILPYILPMLGVVAVATFIFAKKRREEA
jgi:hypothetical protein